MKTKYWAALCMLAFFVIAAPAQADTLNQVTTALKQHAVYVSPGTPGTTADTAAQIQQLLTDGDNIVIAMLPAGSVSGDPTGFAKKLQLDLGAGVIIGLSVGDQTYAYSALMPAGTADDLMQRAVNVSTSTVGTLQTFIGNVHDWQSQNPKAQASKPHKTKKHSSGFGLIWIILIIAAAAAILVLFFVKKASSGPGGDQDRIKFDSPVSDDLKAVAKMRSSINDPQMKEVLSQVCVDVEAYFDRFCKDPDKDAGIFRNHLKNLRMVLEKYVEIQNSPARYYDDPEKLMAGGKQAVLDFEQYVTESIKRGSHADLTNYSVNTEILSAQKLKYV